MLNKVYANLKNSYACTFNNTSIRINVGFGYILTITQHIRNGCNIFEIVSNKRGRPVYIDCPIDEYGYSDIVSLYRFIDNFSNLI